MSRCSASSGWWASRFSLIALLTIVGRAAARRPRPGPHALRGRAVAVTVTWAIHAGVDWDWEMPAVTLWVFALGGAALAAATGKAFCVARRNGAAPAAASWPASASRSCPASYSSLRPDWRKAPTRSSAATALTAIETPADRRSQLWLCAPEPYEIRAYSAARRNGSTAGVAGPREARSIAIPRTGSTTTDWPAQGGGRTEPRPEAIRRSSRLNRLNPKDQEARASSGLLTEDKVGWRGTSAAPRRLAVLPVDAMKRYGGLAALVAAVLLLAGAGRRGRAVLGIRAARVRAAKRKRRTTGVRRPARRPRQAEAPSQHRTDEA